LTVKLFDSQSIIVLLEEFVKQYFSDFLLLFLSSCVNRKQKHDLPRRAYFLKFENEHQPGTNPVEIDVLVIKKEKDFLPIQILNTKKLSWQKNLWLKSLTSKLCRPEKVKKLIAGHRVKKGNKGEHGHRVKKGNKGEHGHRVKKETGGKYDQRRDSACDPQNETDGIYFSYFEIQEIKTSFL